MNRNLHVVFRPDPTALAAIPAAHVRETMRPLPVEPLAGAPAFVAGAAIVRGRPVPVLDAAKLVTGREEVATRWIAIAVGERSAVLAVHAILGVQPIAPASAPTPLLEKSARGAIQQLSSLDGELLAVLRAARLLELAEERDAK